MLLGIKTDNPVAELYLCNIDGEQISFMSWEANRELSKGLLSKIHEVLKSDNKLLKDLTGLFVYQGPGSFTGLRIGITVMNALAYSLGIPIVGSKDEDWVNEATRFLREGKDDKVVTPFYGSEARITISKK